jgi:hypothetical protein
MIYVTGISFNSKESYWKIKTETSWKDLACPALGIAAEILF